jgi:protein-S-isoprenylcysteine O-methyltransferase Ste14
MEDNGKPQLHPFPALSLKVPPLVLVFLAALAMWLLPPMADMPHPGPWYAWLCGAFGSLGTMICLAGVWAFRRARTTINPMHPDTASSLVVRGIYHHTRNPMYLGFLIVLLAWALYLAKLSALLVPPLFVLYLTLFQIGPEERALRAQFGTDFDLYAAQVRRWL